MLFTGSKTIYPSRIYRIFKIAKYIQLPCGRGGGGANTKVPDMYGGGGVFSGPKTQK